MFRKMLFLPAVLLGMFFGLPCLLLGEMLRSGETEGTWFLVGWTTAVLMIYGGLTWGIYRVRERTFGLSVNQLRLAWISAFLLGAVGLPVAMLMA